MAIRVTALLVAALIAFALFRMASSKPAMARSRDDITLAKTCEPADSLAKGSSQWANAIAACVDKRGSHATIQRFTDPTTGVTTYSVRWHSNSTIKGINLTGGNTNTETTVYGSEPLHQR